MQNAKDTFYELLRMRLAAINPGRTIVIRNITRPGILVVENEFARATHPPDCFRLRWTETVARTDCAMPLVTMQCAIDYETAGTTLSGGMDRGRALAAMDAEMIAALNVSPQNMVKSSYAGLADGGLPVVMGSSIWWGQPIVGPSEAKEDRLSRTILVSVMSFQEAGEL